MDNPDDVHGCYVYPPIGGYATHMSGCDDKRGVVECPWSNWPHRQAGCIARDWTGYDAVRQLYGLTEKGHPDYVSSRAGICKVDPRDPVWHWKTLRPNATIFSRDDIAAGRAPASQDRPSAAASGSFTTIHTSSGSAASGSAEPLAKRSKRTLRKMASQRSFRIFADSAAEVLYSFNSFL